MFRIGMHRSHDKRSFEDRILLAMGEWDARPATTREIGLFLVSGWHTGYASKRRVQKALDKLTTSNPPLVAQYNGPIEYRQKPQYDLTVDGRAIANEQLTPGKRLGALLRNSISLIALPLLGMLAISALATLTGIALPLLAGLILGAGTAITVAIKMQKEPEKQPPSASAGSEIAIDETRLDLEEEAYGSIAAALKSNSSSGIPDAGLPSYRTPPPW